MLANPSDSEKGIKKLASLQLYTMCCLVSRAPAGFVNKAGLCLAKDKVLVVSDGFDFHARQHSVAVCLLTCGVEPFWQAHALRTA